MVRVEVEAAWAVTPERVFALYVDAARVPEWRRSIRAIDADGSLAREGTTYTRRYRGLRPPSHGRVVCRYRLMRRVRGGGCDHIAGSRYSLTAADVFHLTIGALGREFGLTPEDILGATTTQSATSAATREAGQGSNGSVMQ